MKLDCYFAVILTTLLFTASLQAAESVPAKEGPEVWRKSCDGGDAKACLALGVALEEGTHGLTAAPKAAAKRYDRACKKKLADGCMRFGDLYARGVVKGSLRKAKGAYERACKLDHAQGCHLVAQTYTPGKKKHIAFEKKACELKLGEACFAIAVAYKGGFVKGTKPEEANVWFQKACDLGYRAGCGHVR